MSAFSLEQLKEQSKAIFTENPTVDKLLATDDGQFFLPNKENAANLHAKSANPRNPKPIHKILRVDVMVEATAKTVKPSKKTDKKEAPTADETTGENTGNSAAESETDNLGSGVSEKEETTTTTTEEFTEEKLNQLKDAAVILYRSGAGYFFNEGLLGRSKASAIVNVNANAELKSQLLNAKTNA